MTIKESVWQHAFFEYSKIQRINCNPYWRNINRINVQYSFEWSNWQGFIYKVRSHLTDKHGVCCYALGDHKVTPTRIVGTGETIKLIGTGFSSIPANNTVKFGTAAATVTAASPTELSVVVPSEAVKSKVTVQVASLFASSENEVNISKIGINQSSPAKIYITGSIGTSLAFNVTNPGEMASADFFYHGITSATETYTKLSIAIPSKWRKSSQLHHPERCFQ